MIPIIDYDTVSTNNEYRALLTRGLTFDPLVETAVRQVISDVRTRGDAALVEYTERFDGVTLADIAPVPRDTLERLHAQVGAEFLRALREAIDNIRDFHRRQVREDIRVEKDGVRMSLRYTPVGIAGIYVPGGAGAYPSTIVMNAVPAQVAGVERIVAVTPPAQFHANPHVAAAFVELGINEIYTVGGAQAVAALAYGSGSIPAVDKIVGPGNIYVSEAKRQVFGQVDIDMFAGPSEIVVVADDSADPAFVAADLLSQAEHGSGREMAVLLTPSHDLAGKVRDELDRQLADLPRGEAVRTVIEANAIIIVRDLDQAAEAVNRIAPEHLELMVADTHALLAKVKNAGAIFMGPWSPEPISDYYGGTNHVLPTSGAARYASPLGVYDFQKCSNVVEYSQDAVRRCCDRVAILARSEGFEAHARSVAIRCRDTQ